MGIYEEILKREVDLHWLEEQTLNVLRKSYAIVKTEGGDRAAQIFTCKVANHIIQAALNSAKEVVVDLDPDKDLSPVELRLKEVMGDG